MQNTSSNDDVFSRSKLMQIIIIHSPTKTLNQIKGKRTVSSLRYKRSSINYTQTNRLIKESLEHFIKTEKLHKKPKNINSVREIITTLMTFLIDSDKINDFQFLDAFCSNNILSTLQKLNNLGIYLINYSLIQALSFLLVNLTNNTTTYYIYSNNILNEICN